MDQKIIRPYRTLPVKEHCNRPCRQPKFQRGEVKVAHLSQKWTKSIGATRMQMMITTGVALAVSRADFREQKIWQS